jgi:DNA (cytosine-5)-methyltransferase 1
MEPTFIIIDLFCGAGGTTTGFAQAQLDGINVAKVVACVNHDAKAIKSHWLNHPEVKHFEEDIRTLDLTELKELVNKYRLLYPNAYIVLWASLECTNFSKAKGGQPRDADSRTLADHLYRYVEALNPDYVQIENVVEFMSWGPLDENGKPVSRKNGQDWMRWRKDLCKYGYYDEWKEMNSANFGAYTSRNRLFGCFAKDGLPIIFPQPTHAKNPVKHSMFEGELQKWKAVKEVLDFADEGESIFTRKKELSEKTLERIEAGLIKYVAKGDTAFISKYFSGRPKGKVNSVDEPASTVTTFGGQTLVQPEFLLQTYAANSKGHNTFGIDQPSRTVTTRDSTSIVQPISVFKYNSTDKTGKHYQGDLDKPCPTIIARGTLGLVQGEFLTHYYGNGFNTGSNEPLPTITTKERSALVQPEYFIANHYGKSSQNQSIDQPAGTILPTDKHRLVEVEPFIMPTNYDNQPKSIEEPLQTITANRKHHYIVNPSHGGHSTSTEAPCPVIVARQDKAPLYLVQCEAGPVAIAVYEGDSECMIRIKQFMAVYGLIDIKMRMLRVHELLAIQGFPASYQLCGNQSDQKKFIGNSVVPHVVRAWCEAMAAMIHDHRKRGLLRYIQIEENKKVA